LVYSQIWLKIIREDRHFFFIFLWICDVSKVVLAAHLLRHNFKPRFRGCWPWQVVSTTVGNTERQTHPSNLWGKPLTPPATPGADAGKAIAILCILWNDFEHKVNEISVCTFAAQYVHATKLQQCNNQFNRKHNSPTLQSVVYDLR